MAIEVKNLALLPVGKHSGIITNAEQVDRDFHSGKGLERVLEITITPKQPADGNGTYGTVSVIFTPALNPQSALGEFLTRLGMAPDWKNGGNWEESTLIGTEVSFTATHERVGAKAVFPRVAKDSINRAK